jgi:hypothetical protein
MSRREPHAQRVGRDPTVPLGFHLLGYAFFPESGKRFAIYVTSARPQHIVVVSSRGPRSVELALPPL